MIFKVPLSRYSFLLRLRFVWMALRGKDIEFQVVFTNVPQLEAPQGPRSRFEV